MSQSASVNPKTYASAPAKRVAFLGLGVMGYPMAGHLALAGHQVTVFNRTPAKAQSWIQEFAGQASTLGAHASAPTPRQAAQGAERKAPTAAHGGVGIATRGGRRAADGARPRGHPDAVVGVGGISTVATQSTTG